MANLSQCHFRGYKSFTFIILKYKRKWRLNATSAATNPSKFMFN